MELVDARRALVEVTTQLVGEYEGVMSAGSVIRCVVRCRDELERAGVRAGLVPAVDAMARHRLMQRTSRHAVARLSLAGAV